MTLRRTLSNLSAHWFREYGLLDKDHTVLANLESNIVSVIQAGAFGGALCSTWLADLIGRRWSLILASILAFIGVGLQAGATGHLGILYVGRCVHSHEIDFSVPADEVQFYCWARNWCRFYGQPSLYIRKCAARYSRVFDGLVSVDACIRINGNLSVIESN